jgi:hypothetical protein
LNNLCRGGTRRVSPGFPLQTGFGRRREADNLLQNCVTNILPYGDRGRARSLEPAKTRRTQRHPCGHYGLTQSGSFYTTTSATASKASHCIRSRRDGRNLSTFRPPEEEDAQKREGVSTPTVLDVLPNRRSASWCKSTVYGLNGQRVYFVIALSSVSYGYAI